MCIITNRSPKRQSRREFSEYVKRKQDQLRLADSRIADLLTQERTDEIAAQIKKIRNDKDTLYDAIQRGNDKLDELAEETIFRTKSSVMTVTDAPPSLSGSANSATGRTARRISEYVGLKNFYIRSGKKTLHPTSRNC